MYMISTIKMYEVQWKCSSATRLIGAKQPKRREKGVCCIRDLPLHLFCIWVWVCFSVEMNCLIVFCLSPCSYHHSMLSSWYAEEQDWNRWWCLKSLRLSSDKQSSIRFCFHRKLRLFIPSCHIVQSEKEIKSSDRTDRHSSTSVGCHAETWFVQRWWNQWCSTAC